MGQCTSDPFAVEYSPRFNDFFCSVGPTTPLGRYTAITRWRPNFLWLGSLEDEVQAETLSLVSGATADNATDSLNLSPLNQAMFVFGNNTSDAARATDISILSIPDAPTSSSLVIVFRIPVAGPLTALSLFGKRDPSAPNEGMEILVNTGGGIVCRLDATGGVIDAPLSGTSYEDGVWHVLVCAIDRAANVVRVGSESEPDTDVALPAGSAINTVLAALGAQRRPAIGNDDAVFGSQVGIQCEGRNLSESVAKPLAIELFWTILLDDEGFPMVDDMGDPMHAWVS